LNCVHGECVDSTITNDVWSGTDYDFSSLTDFYENHTSAFWIIIGSLSLLFILFIFHEPNQTISVIKKMDKNNWYMIGVILVVIIVF